MAGDLAAPPRDHSEVVIFPPLIPLSGFLTGVLLNRVRPAHAWMSSGVQLGARSAGVMVFLFGAAGFVWMVRTMKRAGTPIHNSATPTALVQRGPFAVTRNPMYLFGSIAYAGLALMAPLLWSLALLPIVLVATHYGVVLREEAFLERHFGEAYKQYRSRVPRWL